MAVDGAESGTVEAGQEPVLKRQRTKATRSYGLASRTCDASTSVAPDHQAAIRIQAHMRGRLARSAFLQWARLNPSFFPEIKSNPTYIPRPWSNFSHPALLYDNLVTRGIYRSPSGELLYRRQKHCAEQLERRGFFIAKGIPRLGTNAKAKIRASKSWEKVFNGRNRRGQL